MSDFRPRLDSKYSQFSNEEIELILESRLRGSKSEPFSGFNIKAQVQPIRALIPAEELADLALDATLQLILTDTTSLDGKDFATQTTLAFMKTALDTVVTKTTSIDGKDFSTQTTLAGLAADIKGGKDLNDLYDRLGNLFDAVDAAFDAVGTAISLGGTAADAGIAIAGVGTGLLVGLADAAGNVVGGNASGEMKVNDADTNTKLTAMDSSLDNIENDVEANRLKLIDIDNKLGIIDDWDSSDRAKIIERHAVSDAIHKVSDTNVSNHASTTLHNAQISASDIWIDYIVIRAYDASSHCDATGENFFIYYRSPTTADYVLCEQLGFDSGQRAVYDGSNYYVGKTYFFSKSKKVAAGATVNILIMNDSGNAIDSIAVHTHYHS